MLDGKQLAWEGRTLTVELAPECQPGQALRLAGFQALAPGLSAPARQDEFRQEP